MSLYGRTDSNANKTQAGLARGNGSGSVSETIVFIDAAEAELNENKTRGLCSPGWWAYSTYTTANGDTRHKAEQLAFISILMAPRHKQMTPSQQTLHLL